MKLLTIGTDRKLFDEKSDVFLRQIEYASKMEELHIIVFSLKRHRLAQRDIGNLHIYPTNSLVSLFYVFDAITLGKKIVSDSKITVISCQDPFESGLVGSVLHKKFGLPLQLQIHTDFLSPYFKNSILNRIRVVLTKFLIPKASGLRVVSSVIADSIKSKFPKLQTKIDILPIFIDIPQIMSGVPIEQRLTVDDNEYRPEKILISFPQFDQVILMASRLSPEKRIDIALDAFAEVVRQFPKAGLIVVGDGREENNLKNLMHMQGLSKNVIFLGWRDDLSVYYKLANMFLLTSEFEGYAMTLIQAGAFGCPIVTTNVGIAKTDLFKNGENAFVCPVDNIDCIAKSIVELINSPEKRDLFKTRMQDSIKRIAISREEYVSRYVGLLQNII